MLRSVGILSKLAEQVTRKWLAPGFTDARVRDAHARAARFTRIAVGHPVDTTNRIVDFGADAIAAVLFDAGRDGAGRFFATDFELSTVLDASMQQTLTVSLTAVLAAKRRTTFGIDAGAPKLSRSFVTLMARIPCVDAFLVDATSLFGAAYSTVAIGTADKRVALGSVDRGAALELEQLRRDERSGQRRQRQGKKEYEEA